MGTTKKKVVKKPMSKKVVKKPAIRITNKVPVVFGECEAQRVDLKPHPRNYKKHPADQIKHIQASLKQNGFYRRIVVARDNTILCGHGVVEAATGIGITSIPVFRMDLASDSAKALKILTIDNELGKFGETNDRQLTELLKELQSDVDVEGLLGTGFDESMLAALTMVTRPASEIATFDAAAEWVGLPEYNPGEGKFKVIVNCESVESRSEFLTQHGLTDHALSMNKGKCISVRWPLEGNADTSTIKFVDKSSNSVVIQDDELRYKHVQGGNVPGGHNVICDGDKPPFITPMAECNAIELRHSDVVVDLGAYVGTYAIRCARFPVKKVIAYEPTPSTYRLLSLTKLPNMEVLQRAVVGDDSKEIAFYISKGIGVTNSIVESGSKSPTVVPATRYEDAVREATIVKIDVEGGEYGYKRIVQPNLRAIIIDFHPVGSNWKSNAERIIADIENAGFKPVISPKWDNGWTRAGCWLRDVEDPGGGYELLMGGEACCGCGAPLKRTGKRSLCLDCVPNWRPKHRLGYTVGERL